MRMNTRLLKPSFFSSEKVAELPPIARVFLMGLWCIADREGRLEDRPKRIKAMVMPYDDIDPDELLFLLQEKGHITRYSVSGLNCVLINSWAEHGKPFNNEKPSLLPDKSLSGCFYKATTRPHSSLGEATGKPRESHSIKYTVALPSEAQASCFDDELKQRVNSTAMLKNISSEDEILKKQNAHAEDGGLGEGTENKNPASGDARALFEYYLKSWGKNPKTYLLTPGRRQMILKALKIHSLEVCKQAVDKFRNDNFERRAEFNGLEYLFGNDKRISKWCSDDSVSVKDDDDGFLNRVMEIRNKKLNQQKEF